MESGEREAASSRGQRANRDLIVSRARDTQCAKICPNLSLREALPLFPALTAAPRLLAPLPSDPHPGESDTGSFTD